MKIVRNILLSLLFVIIPSTLSAQKVDEISGEYTYYGSADESPAACLKKAEEGAVLNALEKKYGSIVTQNMTQNDRISGDKETSEFMMLSSSEVNGQWLGYTENPKKKVEMDNQGNVVATVKVKGRAMRLSNNMVDFEAIVLRNGTDKNKFADTKFKEDDSLYIYFTSAEDGYLSIFLIDEDKNAFCMFPYRSAPTGQAKLKRGYEYILFDSNRPDAGFGTAEDLVVTTSRSLEYNKIFILYSPTPYSLLPLVKSVTSNGYIIPPHTTYEKFTSWLSKLRATDPRLGVKMMNLTIQSK